MKQASGAAASLRTQRAIAVANSGRRRIAGAAASGRVSDRTSAATRVEFQRGGNSIGHGRRLADHVLQLLDLGAEPKWAGRIADLLPGVKTAAAVQVAASGTVRTAGNRARRAVRRGKVLVARIGRDAKRALVSGPG
jgi:hypothetical protein